MPGSPSVLEQMAVISGWRPRDVVALMWNYLDESGEFNEAVSPKVLRRLTLGGFFAPWDAIRRLCEEWRAALEVESLGEFHMKEIASDEHNYANWPKDRQNRLDRFVDILC